MNNIFENAVKAAELALIIKNKMIEEGASDNESLDRFIVDKVSKMNPEVVKEILKYV